MIFYNIIKGIPPNVLTEKSVSPTLSFRKGFIMKKNGKTFRLLAVLLAFVLMTALLAGCSSSKHLDDQLAYATGKASDYAHFTVRNNSIFSNEMFSRAYAAAMMIKDDTTKEEFEQIAKYLFLDSITVADTSRTVIASYPEGEAGKKLKDIEDKKAFCSIIKDVSVKQMSDPVPVGEDGEYSVLVGVKRTDGTGVVVVGITTDRYADVCGSNLAEKCGVNTVIVQGDAVLSSTISGVKAGDTLESLGLSENDLDKGSFSLSADSVSYNCKSAKAEDLTVICAETK